MPQDSGQILGSEYNRRHVGNRLSVGPRSPLHTVANGLGSKNLRQQGGVRGIKKSSLNRLCETKLSEEKRRET